MLSPFPNSRNSDHRYLQSLAASLGGGDYDLEMVRSRGTEWVASGKRLASGVIVRTPVVRGAYGSAAFQRWRRAVPLPRLPDENPIVLTNYCLPRAAHRYRLVLEADFVPNGLGRWVSWTTAASEGVVGAARTAEAVIVRSELSRDALINAGGVEASRVRVIPHYMAGLAAVDRLVEQPQRVSGLHVAFVGHPARHKGLERLCAAVQVLRTRGRSCFLSVFSSFSDGPVANVHVADEVVTDARQRDVLRALTAADVIVLPSIKDAVPQCLVEAAASGCALVHASEPLISSVFGTASVACNALDVAGIVEVLDAFISDPMHLAERKLAAQQLYERVLAPAVVEAQYRSLFRELAAG